MRHLRGIAGIHRCADNDRACASRVCSRSLAEVQILLALSAVHVPCDRIAVIAGRHRHGQVLCDAADGNNAGSYTGDRCAIRAGNAGRSEAAHGQRSGLSIFNVTTTDLLRCNAVVLLLKRPVHSPVIVLQRHRNGLVFLDAAQGEGLPAVRHFVIHAVTLQRTLATINLGDDLLIARRVGDGAVSQDVLVVLHIVRFGAAASLDGHNVVIRRQLQRYRDVGRNVRQLDVVRRQRDRLVCSALRRDLAALDDVLARKLQICHGLRDRLICRHDFRLLDRNISTGHNPVHRMQIGLLVHRVEGNGITGGCLGLLLQGRHSDRQRTGLINCEVHFRRICLYRKSEEFMLILGERGAGNGRTGIRQVNQLTQQRRVIGCALLTIKHHRGGIRHQIEPAIAIGLCG